MQGNLPVGLTLNSTNGLIRGISHVVSGHSSEFTVRVTDTGNPSDYSEKVFTIYVIDQLECGAVDFIEKVTDSAKEPNDADMAYSLNVICCESCFEIGGNVGGMEDVSVL